MKIQIEVSFPLLERVIEAAQRMADQYLTIRARQDERDREDKRRAEEARARPR